LGPPEPIVGGLVNHYTLVTVRGNYLQLEMRGFNADGSYIGVLDSFEIGTDPGLICRVLEVTPTPAGLRLRWSSVADFRYRIETSSDLKSWSELQDSGQPVEVPAAGAETYYVVPWASPLPPGQCLRVRVLKP